MDYQTLYDSYWQRPDRHGSHSFQDAAPLVREILSLEPRGAILDIGCGMGRLVNSLASSGHDAHGVDISEVALEYCQSHCRGSFQQGSVLDLPYADNCFDTVVSTDCLEHLAEEDVPKVAAEISRVTRRQAYLRVATRPDRDRKWHLSIHPRRWWEKQFLATDFRKHPTCQEITPFETLELERREFTSVLQKIPTESLPSFPPDWLEKKRDLHADMLRESNRRSDAHIARYQLARSLCPLQARVLDAACGLGYGSAILAEGRPQVEVLGVDIDPEAIGYATHNYAGHALSFQTADVERLCPDLPNGTFDFIASFETLEHVRHPEKVIEAASNLLHPGGLFLCSVPNQWVDETGSDPNPWHLQVFDYDKLSSLVEPWLETVSLFAQIAGNGNRFPEHPRTLRKIPEGRNPMQEPAEWCLLLARKRTS